MGGGTLAPRMSQGKPTPVRARAVARMKALAAAGATSVIASCGYGVVDPLPQPTCFESPKPTVTARLLPADAGADEQLIEVKVAFTQTGVTVGEVRVDGGVKLKDKQVRTNEIVILLVDERRSTSASLSVEATCNGAARPLRINLSLGRDSVTVSAY